MIICLQIVSTSLSILVRASVADIGLVLIDFGYELILILPEFHVLERHKMRAQEPFPRGPLEW